MKNQYLLLSTSTILAMSTITAISPNSVFASDLTFFCQSNQGTPTTIAKNSSGTEQPIFHWKLDQATISNTPEELCNVVTQKLNDILFIVNYKDLDIFIHVYISSYIFKITFLLLRFSVLKLFLCYHSFCYLTYIT